MFKSCNTFQIASMKYNYEHFVKKMDQLFKHKETRRDSKVFYFVVIVIFHFVVVASALVAPDEQLRGFVKKKIPVLKNLHLAGRA